MRERKGAVVVDRDDEVAVFRGQVELFQVVDVVPRGRPDDHRAPRIGSPDDGQCLMEQGVPECRSELLVRLIEDLEEHAVGSFLAVLGDSPPDGQHPLFVAGWIVAHRLKFVEVENHQEMAGQGMFERPIERVEPGGAEIASGPRWLSRNGWRLIRTCLKPASWIAGSTFPGSGHFADLSDGIVAQYVHAPSQLLVLTEGIGLRGRN